MVAPPAALNKGCIMSLRQGRLDAGGAAPIEFERVRTERVRQASENRYPTLDDRLFLAELGHWWH